MNEEINDDPDFSSAVIDDTDWYLPFKNTELQFSEILSLCLCFKTSFSFPIGSSLCSINHKLKQNTVQMILVKITVDFLSTNDAP